VPIFAGELAELDGPLARVVRESPPNRAHAPHNSARARPHVPRCSTEVTRMKLRLYFPLIGYVVPTVIIGYGFVIPRAASPVSTSSRLGSERPFWSVRYVRPGRCCRRAPPARARA